MRHEHGNVHRTIESFRLRYGRGVRGGIREASRTSYYIFLHRLVSLVTQCELVVLNVSASRENLYFADTEQQRRTSATLTRRLTSDLAISKSR